MTRLFEQHRIRRTVSLDGTWDFHFPKSGTTLDPLAWRDGTRERLEVPGVWERLDARRNYRGQAVARREIVLTGSGRVRLQFKGISHTARIFWDGREVGAHHNAFTAFVVDAGEAAAGTHELLAHISNEHGAVSALHRPNDYYTYGGINRPAEVQLLAADLVIEHIHVQTVPAGAGWRALCRARVVNLSGTACRATLRAALGGARHEREEVVAPGANEYAWELVCADVAVWSPEHPALYRLEAELMQRGAAVDDLIERVGFRTVAVAGEQILLNGAPVYPMGFNRHEDHGLHGCAIPVEVMRADLAQMQAMHANAVRTSHYPNDERFLDLCDELGILVWEENHARGLNLERMLHPRFREQCATCNAEMVAQHFNHPSIFVWGILNECASETDTGAALYREQFAQLRGLDPSRPVTFASCRHAGDRCQGLVDIAGWNIYPLWYHDTAVLETLADLVTRREQEGMRNKPLIISEFGAGAIPGFHDPVRRAKWSEERQCDILDAQLGAILNHPRVAGAFIWQFCDVRVDEAVAMNRPRTMNNKGVVDEVRRPKLAMEIVRRRFAAKQAELAASPDTIPAAGPEKTERRAARTLLDTPPPRYPTILVKSGWQTINIGDVGHTPGLLALLERQRPDAHLVLWPHDVNPAVEALLRQRFPALEIVHGNAADEGPLTGMLASVFDRADVLIHGSGPSVVAWRDLRDWRRRTGKPYGIYGVSLREIGDELKPVLDHAAFVFTRETRSLEGLRAAGVQCREMGFVPDACVAADVRDDTAAAAWLERAGLKPGRFLCAIPRNRMTPYHWSKEATRLNQSHIREIEDLNFRHREEDLAKLRGAITLWVRATGMPVLLCPEMIDALALLGPHVYAPLPDDVRPLVAMRDKWWLTDEAASIYAQAFAVLSLDCHSPLIALAQGTPAVYVRQPQDDLKANMYHDFGLGEWLLPIEDVDGQAIAERLLRIHADRGAAVEKVNAASRRIRDDQEQALQRGLARLSLPDSRGQH